MQTHRLAREIVAALGLKLIALVLLYVFFFSAPKRIAVTPETMAQALFERHAATRR
jgi:hypothetical protein